MKCDHLTHDILEGLSLDAVVKWALSSGWRIVSEESDDVYILRRAEAPVEEHILPKNRSFADYHDRLRDVVLSTSQYAGRSIGSILNELLYPPSDILRYRLHESSTRDGTIPLPLCETFFKGCIQALKATARIEESPAQYHSRLTGKQTDEFFDECRFGQTERGSFIVNIICPLVVQQPKAPEGQQSMFLVDVSESFTRKTTKRLMSTIDRIISCIQTDDISPLLMRNIGDDVIVSANLCEAISQIGNLERNATLELHSTWARGTTAPPRTPSNVSIPRDYLPRFEEIASHLRPSEQPPKPPYVGHIVALKGKANEDGLMEGGVTLEFLHDGKPIRAHLNLAPREHQIAVDAYRKHLYVKINAEYQESGTYRRLEDVRHIEILSDTSTEESSQGSFFGDDG